jgi:hypothetical protein
VPRTPDNAAMDQNRPHREYGQHRREDAPTHVLVMKGPRDGVVPCQEVLVPVHPSILRQRANINAAAYDRGQGRDL